MKSLSKIILYALILCSVAGCVSPDQFRQYAPFTDPATPLSNPENCRIFVYTQKGFRGAVNFELCEGKKVIGTLLPNGYLCWERNPGEVELSTYSVDDKVRLLTFDSKKGAAYYIRVSANLFPSSPKDAFSFRLVDAAEAQEALKRCTRPCLITH